MQRQPFDCESLSPFTVLQHVPTSRDPKLRSLYWRFWYEGYQGPLSTVPETLPGGEIMLSAGCTLAFDTYFGAFFEQQWRLYTRLRHLVLKLRVEGHYLLRIFRRTDFANQLIHEAFVHDGGLLEVPVALDGNHFRQNGLIYFEIRALSPRVCFYRAEWSAPTRDLSDVGVGVVFCTFNREADITRALNEIVEEREVLNRLARIFVVNQGRLGLATFPGMERVASIAGDRLRIVEQSNFGGAGGFSRGLIECLDDPEVSHVVFLDDDIRLEPDCLLRLASFFSLAEIDNPVGGHMLDLVQPTHLYEAGAVVSSRDWTFHPQHCDLDLAHTPNLTRLLEPYPIHYNGWWCFGFSKALIKDVGMPLPCFIRGDDVEFGLRLQSRGKNTIPLAGMGVWHEPFYLKVGSWQLYYETRNLLIAAALHFGPTRTKVTARMLKHLLLHLLTFRYYSSALIVKGIEDFLHGTRLLHSDPLVLHRALDKIKESYPTAVTPRHAVIDNLVPPALPVGRGGYVLALMRALWRQATEPTRACPPGKLSINYFCWALLKKLDHIALETWWDRDMPTFHRSRKHFWTIGLRAAKALLSLYFRAPQLRREWQRGAPGLTSVWFWREYLGLASPAINPGKQAVPYGEGRLAARATSDQLTDLPVVYQFEIR